MDASWRKQHEAMLQEHARVGATLTALTVERLHTLLEDGRISAADSIRLLHEATQLERTARALLQTREEAAVNPPVATTIINLAKLEREQQQWERSRGYQPQP